MNKPILEHAQEITSGDRRRDYGRPLINHLRIALEWSGVLGHVVTPSQVVWMMIGLKKARAKQTPTYDNILDTIGYAVCLDDMARQLVEENYCLSYKDALQFMDNLSYQGMVKLLERLEIQARGE